jgi:predicted nucleic acid-binding protein
MSRARVIVDTDILSMFAKADAVAALGQFLGEGRAAMTPAIRDEIAVPLQYGYEFPGRALSRISVVPLTRQAWHEYEQLRAIGAPLGRGELEAIAFCMAEGALFATNDLAARQFAQERGVQVISLQAILRGLWLSGMQSKSSVRELFERIKQADRLEVPLDVELEVFGEDDLASAEQL